MFDKGHDHHLTRDVTVDLTADATGDAKIVAGASPLCARGARACARDQERDLHD